MCSLRIHRAPVEEIEPAYALVQEYFDAASVVLRESRAQFAREYFAPCAGLWLATADHHLAGCIALRELRSGKASLGEIKRMYVRPAHRGRGIADALLLALEGFAVRCDYRELVLDTTDEMISAIRLYERHGYTRCDRYNDNPQATIFMKKPLVRRESPNTAASLL